MINFTNLKCFYILEIFLPTDCLRIDNSEGFGSENIPPSTSFEENRTTRSQIIIENPEPVNDNSYASIVKGDQMIATLTGIIIIIHLIIVF